MLSHGRTFLSLPKAAKRLPQPLQALVRRLDVPFKAVNRLLCVLQVDVERRVKDAVSTKKSRVRPSRLSRVGKKNALGVKERADLIVLFERGTQSRPFLQKQHPDG